MKKSKLLITSLVVGSILCSCGGSSDVKKVGILKYVTDTPLDLAEKGFIQGLEDNGFKDGDNIKISESNPNAQEAQNASMASNLALSNDLVFGIATPSAKALKTAVDNNGGTVPVVFTAVTDPVGANLVSSMTGHKENVTGMSDMTDVKLIVDAMKKFSGTHTVAALYNIGETNSQYQVNLMKAAVESESGWKFVDKGVSDDNLITSTVNSLPDTVDVLYIPTDNHIVAAINSVRAAVKDKKIITICADSSVTDTGVMVGVGVDYFDLGKKSGEMAAKILNGTPAKDIDCAWTDKPVTKVNLTIAKEGGVTIPQELLDEAGTSGIIE